MSFNIYDIETWTEPALEPASGMRGWAARYSSNIERDFRRGFSVQGWSLHAEPSPEEMRASLVDQYGWSTAQAGSARIVYVDELGGYLPVHEGLCAFFMDGEEDDEDVRADVIAAAQDDPSGRFAGIPLYVFRAQFLAPDTEDGEASIVRPLGQPERVEE